MIIAFLTLLGLCMGSFVNALVWRVHEQSVQAKKKKSDRDDREYQKRLNIATGASMCPHCKHKLGVVDLIPVLSWLALRGKCRYCHKPISAQYPLVELAGAGLFVASYCWWPDPITGAQVAIFVLWLALITGLLALLVYDVRWLLLPNRILYPLGFVAAAQAVVTIAVASKPGMAFLSTLGAVLVGGGLFYVIFQVSQGRWIGGGDVKLGWLLGLIVGTPGKALLFIFIAAICGSLVSLPLLTSGRMKRTSLIPFGPFLIVGAVVANLFGADILHWYQQAFINF